MKLIIIAGGKGTRLGLTNIPKPMALINGKPILQYQIELAKRYNIEEIYILLGYLSEVVIDYFGDGHEFGVKIHYIVEKESLGTAGAIKQLDSVINDRFMVFYGDVLMNINLRDIINFDLQFPNSIGTLIVHHNDHPYDSDLLEVDDCNRIINFYSKPHPSEMLFNNLVNGALYIFSPKIFKYIDVEKKEDFGKDIFPLLINKKKELRAYYTSEYLKDMGTPERLKQVENDMISGRVYRLNKELERKAIFLDRDGVINEEGLVVRLPEDLKIIKGVPDAIRRINNSDYLSIIITNQPGVAKGFFTIEMLKEVHKKIESVLGQNGAYIDKIYFCPHHPESGFEGEVSELKIDCDCRKPKIGMINAAIKEFNINIEGSYFIGDSTVDIKTAQNCGMKSILLKTGHAGLDKNFNIIPDFEFDTLNNAIDYILK